MESDRDVRATRHQQLSGGSVTRHDAERLWAELLDGHRTWRQVSDDAIALVERVDAENRIVNDGLLWLYYLWQSEEKRQPDVIFEARRRFRAALAAYDADREGWELRYVLRHLVGSWSRRGREAAMHTARIFLKDGTLSAAELQDFLSRAPDDGSPPPVP